MNVRWSNAPSGNGSASALASTSSTRVRRSAGGRPPASPGSGRDPVTRNPRACSSAATSPVPVATSSTAPPSAGTPRDEEAAPAGILTERQRPPRPGRRSSPERGEEAPGVLGGATTRLYPGAPWPCIDDLERAAAAAAAHARDGETVTAVLAAEATDGRRRYVCALETRRSARSPRLDRASTTRGSPVADRTDVRDAVTDLRPLRDRGRDGRRRRPRRAALPARRDPADRGPTGHREMPRTPSASFRSRSATPPSVASPARLDGSGRPRAGSSRRSTRQPGRRSQTPCARRQEAVAELTREVEQAATVLAARRQLTCPAWKAAASISVRR